MNPVAYAVLAVIAADAGDAQRAVAHIRVAQRQTRTMARRERQVIEIAALIVAGARARARDLSFEHVAEFPDDEDVLASLLDPLAVLEEGNPT